MSEFFDDLTTVAAHYKTKMLGKGFEVRHSTDFELLTVVSETMGMAITPHFSPRHNAFYQGEAFWIGVYDKDRCVGALAVKRQPLGSESLASYAKRTWTMLYGPGSDNAIIFDREQQPFLERTSGNLVYAGEFRVDPKYQKSGIGVFLAGYMKAMLWQQWPDTEAVYIYMEDKDVRAGLLAAIEMSVQIKNALRWVCPPSQAQPEYWLGAETREEFEGWLRDCLLSIAASNSNMSQGRKPLSGSSTAKQADHIPG
ncbi:hypothetical protein [Hoeflea poritis]|uniref:N-acetyltransferase domain-containing protein n=1 Tax=Hoeflea poritis TaxID=2993659 RepID=A0ABT4VML2_9HYPH|nr:hypothetical protein [Hoeflea poritis]MDA4845961.1 hypothetical protein [Hoeflea poritis]